MPFYFTIAIVSMVLFFVVCLFVRTKLSQQIDYGSEIMPLNFLPKQSKMHITWQASV